MTFVSLGQALCSVTVAIMRKFVLLLPLISIGKMIAESKSTLETVDLFAWTVVVVILSVIIEKLMMLVLKIALKKHSSLSKGGVSLG